MVAPPPPPRPKTAPPPPSAVGSQFHPILGLYSEPLYSYPQPPEVPHPGNLIKSGSHHSHHHHPASLYGTLPRHVPPKPVRQGLNFPVKPKPVIPVDTARKIYEDNAEIMKASTVRMNSSDTSSLTRSNANRRRIRWSQEDLLESRNLRRRFPENEDEGAEDEETTTEDETSTTASSSSSCNFPESKGKLQEFEEDFAENTGRLPANEGRFSIEGGRFPERNGRIPADRGHSEDSCAISGLRGRMTPTGKEEEVEEGEEEEEEDAPPAIPPRRPPRPSRERNSYSRSATLELPSRNSMSRRFPEFEDDDCSDYENDPRSLPEVCVLYTGQQQQRAGAISRP